MHELDPTSLNIAAQPAKYLLLRLDMFGGIIFRNIALEERLMTQAVLESFLLVSSGI